MNQLEQWVRSHSAKQLFRNLFENVVTYLLHVFLVVGLGDLLAVASALNLLPQLGNVSQLQEGEVQRLGRDRIRCMDYCFRCLKSKQVIFNIANFS